MNLQICMFFLFIIILYNLKFILKCNRTEHYLDGIPVPLGGAAGLVPSRKNIPSSTQINILPNKKRLIKANPPYSDDNKQDRISGGKYIELSGMASTLFEHEDDNNSPLFSHSTKIPSSLTEVTRTIPHTPTIGPTTVVMDPHTRAGGITTLGTKITDTTLTKAEPTTVVIPGSQRRIVTTRAADKQPRSGSTAYKKDDTTRSVTKETGEDVTKPSCKYLYYTNQFTKITTEHDCKSECTKESECIGLQFDNNNKRCRNFYKKFITGSNQEVINTDNGSVYKRIKDKSISAATSYSLMTSSCSTTATKAGDKTTILPTDPGCYIFTPKLCMDALQKGAGSHTNVSNTWTRFLLESDLENDSNCKKQVTKLMNNAQPACNGLKSYFVPYPTTTTKKPTTTTKKPTTTTKKPTTTTKKPTTTTKKPTTTTKKPTTTTKKPTTTTKKPTTTTKKPTTTTKKPTTTTKKPTTTTKKPTTPICPKEFPIKQMFNGKYYCYNLNNRKLFYYKKEDLPTVLNGTPMWPDSWGFEKFKNILIACTYGDEYPKSGFGTTEEGGPNTIACKDIPCKEDGDGLLHQNILCLKKDQIGFAYRWQQL